MVALLWRVITFLVIGILLSISLTESANNNTVKTQHNKHKNNNHEETVPKNKTCPSYCNCSFVAICTELKNETYRFIDHIEELIVKDVDSKNAIILSDTIFKRLGLQQLTKIEIINSIITSISPGAFKGLRELLTVHLSANNLHGLDPKTLSHNNKLVFLTITHNPLILLASNGSPFFMISKSIRALDISHNNITSIPKTAFSKMLSLLYVNLKGNHLHGIDSGVFSDLAKLQQVDLSHNFLQSIPGDLFSNNSKIGTILLGDNPISTVIDLQIKQLVLLDVGSAKINTVAPSMFKGMQTISILNFSGNEIAMIDKEAFHILVELELLDLSYNRINFVSNELIKENVKLTVLKIGNNPDLRSLPSSGFTCSAHVFKVIVFDASGCSLETISEDIFKNMPELAYLDLSSNKLVSINSALQASIELIELDLSSNMISSLNKNTFSHNINLLKLHLANNQLTSLSPDLFFSLNKVKVLDVSSCNLTKLFDEEKKPPADFLRALHYLNISNNQIKSVHVVELELIDRVRSIDISQNPLECDTGLITFIMWLVEHKISLANPDEYFNDEKTMFKKHNNQHQWETLVKHVCNESGVSEKNTMIENVSTASRNIDDRKDSGISKNDLTEKLIDSINREIILQHVKEGRAENVFEPHEYDEKYIEVMERSNNVKKSWTIFDINDYDTVVDNDDNDSDKNGVILVKISDSEVASHPELYPNKDSYKKLLAQANEENEELRKMGELSKKEHNSNFSIHYDEMHKFVEAGRKTDQALDDAMNTKYFYYTPNKKPVEYDSVSVFLRILRFGILALIFCSCISVIVKICRKRRQNQQQTLGVDIISRFKHEKSGDNCGVAYQHFDEDLKCVKAPTSHQESNFKNPPECV